MMTTCTPEQLCLGCFQTPCRCTADRPVCASHLEPGTILNGHILIGRVLGQGGFGITYLGWDLNLQIKLAVKEYFPRETAVRLSDGEQVGATEPHLLVLGVEGFLEEARALARFAGHPGVTEVLGYFQANGTGYMSMRYLEGGTLRQYLAERGGRLSAADCLRTLGPVFQALTELHAAGLLHRDISPDNILVTRDEARLIDFGAARQVEQGALSVIVRAGYAPAEQHSTRGRQGPWTDVYALAATIYQAVTGTVPPDALERLDQDTLVPPTRLGAALTCAQEAGLLKALALRSESRVQSVGELQALLQGPDRPEPRRARLPRWAGLLALLLALLVLGVRAEFHHQREEIAALERVLEDTQDALETARGRAAEAVPVMVTGITLRNTLKDDSSVPYDLFSQPAQHRFSQFWLRYLTWDVTLQNNGAGLREVQGDLVAVYFRPDGSRVTFAHGAFQTVGVGMRSSQRETRATQGMGQDGSWSPLVGTWRIEFRWNTEDGPLVGGTTFVVE